MKQKKENKEVSYYLKIINSKEFHTTPIKYV